MKAFVPPFYAIPIPEFLIAAPESVATVNASIDFAVNFATDLTAPVPVSTPIPMAFCLFCLWAVSALVLAGLTLWKNAIFQRALGVAMPVNLTDKIEDLAGVDGLKVFAKANLNSPLLVGLVKPRLYLPSQWSSWSPEQLRGVVAHELAHHRNRDIWALIFQALAMALFGVNPLIWLVNRKLMYLRELRCDEAVLRETNLTPAEYGRLLFGFVDATERPVLNALYFNERGTSLKQRFEHVLNFKGDNMRRFKWQLTVPILVALAIAPFSIREAYTQASEPAQSIFGPGQQVSQIGINHKGELLLDLVKPITVDDLAKELEQLKVTRGTVGLVIKTDQLTPQAIKDQVVQIANQAGLPVEFSPETRGLMPVSQQSDPSAESGWTEGQVHEFYMVNEKPKCTYSEPPKYPQAAWAAGITGKVFLKFLVHKDGSVSHPWVLKGREEFRQAAIDAILKTRYEPAKHKGQAVPVWMTQPISFRLNLNTQAQSSPPPVTTDVSSNGDVVAFYKVEIKPEMRHTVAPKYPEQARKDKVSGKVFLKFKVNVNGSVSDVTVLKGEEVFRRAAIEAVEQFRFKPAEQDGQPVAVWMTLPVTFSLNPGSKDDNSGLMRFGDTVREFMLHANFPNPFNPETTIKYDLAEPTFVTLDIHSVTGQVIRTLVSDNQSAGRYQVRWNGKDESGTPVASGTYYYNLKTDQFSDVKKMQLLK